MPAARQALISALSTIEAQEPNWLQDLTCYVGTAVHGVADIAVGVASLGIADLGSAVTKGTKGTDHDTIEDHVCKTVQNVYACAKPPELLERLGKAPMGDAVKLAGARGDIEVAGTILSTDQPPVSFAAVGQLDRGAVVVRGAVKGLPEMVTSKLKATGKQIVDPSKAAGFAVLNVVFISLTGSTVGHRLLGMQVWQVRPGSFPLQVLVRTALLWLFVPAVLTATDGRGLQDVIAGTRIVRV